MVVHCQEKSRYVFTEKPFSSKIVPLNHTILKIFDFTEKILIFVIFNVLQRSSSSTTASQGSGEGGSSSKAAQPQTLEELLERQWEQGSQFLMEQASHFDSKLISHEFFPIYRENTIIPFPSNFSVKSHKTLI